MKLLATKEKVKIKWFAVLHDGSQVRNNKGFIHYAWDVTCSCGWKTNTGGALRSYIQDEVWYHKKIDHDYIIEPYKRRKHRNTFIESILDGTLTAENFKAGV